MTDATGRRLPDWLPGRRLEGKMQLIPIFASARWRSVIARICASFRHRGNESFPVEKDGPKGRCE